MLSMEKLERAFQAGGPALAKARMRHKCVAHGNSDRLGKSSVWGQQWEDGYAKHSLTGQAGRGVNPLQQLPHTQLTTLVGVVGQDQLAHLHLRRVPVPFTICHGTVVFCT